MADPFIRQDGAGTFSPDKRRVSTQDINNMRKFINDSVDERMHELIGQKHAVVRGGVVTINGGDDTKFDVAETFAVIHGQRIKVPAQAAITPGGGAATRFVILKYNLNESRQVLISATPFDLDKEDGFSLVGQDADAGTSEIRLATLIMSGATIASVTPNLDNLRVDIPANARILTVNTDEIKSILNVETGDIRYGSLLNITGNDIGLFKSWPGMPGGSLNFELDLSINTRILPGDTQAYAALFRYIQIGSTPGQAGLTVNDESGSFVPPTYDPQLPRLGELIDPARTGVGSELKSIRPRGSFLYDVETPSAMTTIGDLTGFKYRIEGNYLQSIFGKNIIISWWVKPSISGTFSVTAHRGDTLRSFIREWIIVPGDIGLWTRKQVSFPLTDIDTGWNFSTGVGLEIDWALGANLTSPGSGFVASQAEVDAEAWIGRNVLTSPNQTNFYSAISRTMEFCMFSTNLGSKFDFQVPEFSQDLTIVSRYVESLGVRFTGFSNNNLLVEASQAFSTKKRIVPNNILGTDVSTGISGLTPINDRDDRVTLAAIKGGNGQYTINANVLSDARL